MQAEHNQIIKDVILAVEGRIWELNQNTRPAGRSADKQQRWTDEEKLTSKLGRDLCTIVAYAEGHSDSASRIMRAIEDINRVLFGLILENGYGVPRDFPRTPLGQIINQALARMYRPEELMTAREVQQSLQVARQTVYDWIEEGKLTPLYINGKIMLPRAKVEEFKARRKQQGGSSQ